MEVKFDRGYFYLPNQHISRTLFAVNISCVLSLMADIKMLNLFFRNGALVPCQALSNATMRMEFFVQSVCQFGGGGRGQTISGPVCMR